MTAIRHRQERRQRDKPGEPEDHGDRFHGQLGVRMGETGKISRCENEVRDGDEQGPDAVEEHEVVGTGRTVGIVWEIEVPADDLGQVSNRGRGDRCAAV